MPLSFGKNEKRPVVSTKEVDRIVVVFSPFSDYFKLGDLGLFLARQGGNFSN